jgi:C4-dicarboxylate-specific signal transduction histidine kinase
MVTETPTLPRHTWSDHPDLAELQASHTHMHDRVRMIESRLRQSEKRRRALIQVMADMNETNKRLTNQRKAMIHIMEDLRKTTAEMERREQELREKQEQLVQAAKLATLGELTTGIAHELNNPLNNIGLFIGNAMDLIELGEADRESILRHLQNATQQVRKATEIISHLRTFGRAAPVSRERVSISHVICRALSLMREQLRLRDIAVELDLCPADSLVVANPIQLEQVFINLLTNARDALEDSARKTIAITCTAQSDRVRIVVRDTGPGIPPELEQRIFDPFFTTKEVGAGTGLGLSIAYGIIRDHQGTITVDNRPGQGAAFAIELPLVHDDRPVGGVAS